ncbi:UNVERIFIED_ORG: hypothetical protein E4P37_10280, partial [Bacillus sp. AZ43]
MSDAPDGRPRPTPRPRPSARPSPRPRVAGSRREREAADAVAPGADDTTPAATPSTARPRGARGTTAGTADRAANCIVFSLANPTPEVDPEMAAKYAAVEI